MIFRKLGVHENHNFIVFIDRYLSYMFILCTKHSCTDNDVHVVTLFIVKYPCVFKLDELVFLKKPDCCVINCSYKWSDIGTIDIYVIKISQNGEKVDSTESRENKNK